MSGSTLAPPGPTWELRVSGLFDEYSSLEFRVRGLGLGVQGLGFRIQGLGFRLWGSGLRV